MRIKRNKLIRALEIVVPGTMDSSQIEKEETDCFIFSEDKIRAGGNNIFVQTNFKTGLNCSVSHSKALLNFLKILKSQYVTLEIKEERLKVIWSESGFSFFKISNQPQKIFEKVYNFKCDNFTPLPEEFLDAVIFCKEEVGDSSSKGEALFDSAFSFLHFDKVHATFCDGIKVSQYILSSPFSKEILLPVKFLDALITHRPISYLLTKDFIHLMNKDETLLSFKLITDIKYPKKKADSLFEKEGEKYTFPKNIIEEIDKFEILASQNKEDQIVDFSLTNKEITCKLIGGLGYLKEKFETEKNKLASFNFRTNPTYIKNLLKFSSEIRIGKRVLSASNKKARKCIAVLV